MSQDISIAVDGKIERLSLPDSDQDVLPGVKWGHHYVLFTPACWATLAWIDEADHNYRNFRIGKTLEEEVAACLLGGYGIPAEVGLAAFYRVRDYGMLAGKPPTDQAIYDVLSEPLSLGRHKIRYRFARQRSKYLSSALSKLYNTQLPTHDELAFRQWLLGLSGVGPKTASWITRNWLESDKVAIIDIHIHRAGLLMGLYRPDESPSKHYFRMEQKFLAFASSISVKASILDALIWRQMKGAGNMVLDLIKRI
jgi:thermostable 8-oxoguanine DNA glycosylase